MNKEIIVKTTFSVLIAVAMVVVFATGAFAYTEEHEKEEMKKYYCKKLVGEYNVLLPKEYSLCGTLY